VVGNGNTDATANVGFIRYSNGAVKTYVAPNSVMTFLTRRNQLGVTVGYYRDVNYDSHGLLLSGSGMATVDYPGAFETRIFGINYWGTIVGIYDDDPTFSQGYAGFKMWKNGSVTTISYPGAMQTNPAAISDTGVIVGWYVPGVFDTYAYPYHGFVLANGVYKTVNYSPNAFRTVLNDINAGVIVGSWDGGGFLYVNGKFKDVKGPNNVQVYTVYGINGYGYVTGISSGGGFTAHCQ
jgi:hypothetical protein